MAATRVAPAANAKITLLDMLDLLENYPHRFAQVPVMRCLTSALARVSSAH
jgi:hypothetical protein